MGYAIINEKRFEPALVAADSNASELTNQ